MKYLTYAKAAIPLVCFIVVMNKLAGFTSVARSTAMTNNDIDVQRRHSYSVRIQVSGRG